ncbi:MAG: hypothetical protein GC134_06505 [Proteobacteria bacterium]|nr:hypothetical protein [Pseudomonadota bacterium]
MILRCGSSIACLFTLLLAGCALTDTPPAVVLHADPVSCIEPPIVHEELNKHGQATWSDDKLYVAHHEEAPVRIPSGWQAVGASKVEGRCALFPDKQAVVFIKPSEWTIKRNPHKEAGITLVRYAPKAMDAAKLARIDRMIDDVHRRVRQIYPLGLREDQKFDHALLVTTDIAGDASNMDRRLFAEPGERLTVFFREPDDGRAYDLLTHTTTHLFNKRRPRTETQPDDPNLSMHDYLEFVASWAELALSPPSAYLNKRVDYIYDVHALVTDDDSTTWPKDRTLKGLRVHKGKIGIPPRTHERSGPMMEYLHYYLCPLSLVALDGLLAKRERKLSVMELLQMVHSSKQSLLDVLHQQLTPNELAQFELWLGGERIPRVLVDAGMARYKTAGYLDWTLAKGWAHK